MAQTERESLKRERQKKKRDCAKLKLKINYKRLDRSTYTQPIHTTSCMLITIFIYTNADKKKKHVKRRMCAVLLSPVSSIG